MGKKKRFLMLLLALSVLAFAAGSIYAMASVVFTNQFVIGGVDIQVKGYQRENTKEVLWQDTLTILPGDRISRIPRIHNNGSECYVRARITLRAEAGFDGDILADICFDGMDDSWIKAEDGYYYRTEILPHGGAADLFDTVVIPADLPQEEMENKSFYLDIDVDAIQSRNFTPDFSAKDPWGDVEILQYIEQDSFEISYLEPGGDTAFRIIYLGNTDQWLTNSLDLFSNISYFMPGDVYEDSLTISNDSDQDRTLYFRSQCPESVPLLDQVGLKIWAQSGSTQTVLYEGNMTAEALEGDTVLGVIPAQGTVEFLFEIQVPAELTNEEAMQSHGVTWIFSGQPMGEADSVVDIPATGEELPLGCWLGAMGLALALAVYAGTQLYRGRTRDEQNQ